MATCKDCLHYDLCKSAIMDSAIIKRLNGFIKLDEAKEQVIKEYYESCNHFKDRSRFVELPCKVGDTVYSVHGHPDYGYKIEALQAQDVALICSSGELSYSKRLNYFGKTVFLTREEAEQALKEREENGKC